MSNVLSPRLRQCLILARDGHTAVEIGFILGLSYRTVNQYLSDAYKRLGARNRMQAVAIAIQRGEIPPTEPMLVPISTDRPSPSPSSPTSPPPPAI
ncbi:helix-turn-helix transcriptional regulator [Caulobacter sp.]|uniref:helix-turn-helix domain-containing protein n=1 Tax=Caulobacter sp. TaxID=78 RepID=UPI0031CE70A9